MRSFIIFCSLAALVCMSINSIGADEEECESTMSPEQCKEYAENKKKGQCVRAEVNGLHIEWTGCGRTECGENTKEVPVDLSKEFPDCCNDCEVVDPSKLSMISRYGK